MPKNIHRCCMCSEKLECEEADTLNLDDMGPFCHSCYAEATSHTRLEVHED